MDPIVYIVDDDISVRIALERLLFSAGFESRTFASADEFLNSGFREERACLVTDIKMSELTGFELKTKMNERGCSMPVIFMTGYDTTESRGQAKRMGASGYLCKPVDDTALLDAIDWALNDQ